MKDVRKRYTIEMYDNFGYYATWEPNTPVELGEIGILKNKEFTRISTLQNEEIEFKVKADETKGEIDYSSSGGVKIYNKLAGKAAPKACKLAEADAGFIVDFTKENSVLFKAKGTLTYAIDNIIALKREIMKRYESGDWDAEWVIVTHLIKAESATILIAGNSGSSIELKARGKAGIKKIDIADAEANFEISFSQGVETKIIGAEGITPLFKLMGVRKRLFRNDDFGPKAVEDYKEVMEKEKGELKEEIFFDEIELEIDE